MMPPPPTLNRRRFILAATALLLGGCAGRQSPLPEFDPTKIGSPGMPNQEIIKKEKGLAHEVSNHKLSEEEQFMKDNIDEQYDRARLLRDEQGNPIDDFIEGSYTMREGKIYVNFFQRPLRTGQVGLPVLSNRHYRYVMVPLEKAFLVSQDILKDWRDHDEANIRAEESQGFVKGLNMYSREQRKAKEHQKRELYQQALDFLDIRPKPSHNRLYKSPSVE